MGNCVQSSHGSGGRSGGAIEAGCRQPLQRRRSAASDEEEVIIDHQAPSVIKVKMVLTKGELGWLVTQLKAGNRRLEDVLQEMARKREGRLAADGEGWQPSLESIVECPAEALDDD